MVMETKLHPKTKLQKRARSMHATFRYIGVRKWFFYSLFISYSIYKIMSPVYGYYYVYKILFVLEQANVSSSSKKTEKYRHKYITHYIMSSVVYKWIKIYNYICISIYEIYIIKIYSTLFINWKKRRLGSFLINLEY